MFIVLVLFILAYILMLTLTNYKHYIALLFASLFIMLGYISITDAFMAIDYNILLMLFGTMGTVSLFIESKMPSKIADNIISKVPNIKWLTICLALFAGIVSAFVDNVATVLMIIPVTIILAKKLNISPVPIAISVSIFSNLEGAATLVGDTTSILLAGKMHLDFADFFWYEGKIGLFFIVQLGLMASTLVLAFLQRKNTNKIESTSNEKVKDYVPTFLLVSTIISLIVASFFDNKPILTNGYICTSYFLIGLIIKLIETKSFKSLLINIKEVDYSTLLLLASLFVIVGTLDNVGLIKEIGNVFVKIGGSNQFVLYTLIVFTSVLISAFIDNIPYVATMLPVISSITAVTNINPTVLFYGLIIGATLGGNITPIGASANITTIGLLKKNGYAVKNKEYFKYSIPISLAAILTGYLLVLGLF